VGEVVLHQLLHQLLLAAVVVPVELGELGYLVVPLAQVVLDCQHFKEILEFQYLMELLDQHQEDILLVVEVVEIIQELVLNLAAMVAVEKDRQDLLLEL
jgi:hypothetical protein